MFSLISVIIVLVVVYLVMGKWPLLAAALAVLPVKIIGTSLMAYEQSILGTVIGGMLFWQFFWGIILLGIYLCVR